MKWSTLLVLFFFSWAGYAQSVYSISVQDETGSEIEGAYLLLEDGTTVTPQAVNGSPVLVWRFVSAAPSEYITVVQPQFGSGEDKLDFFTAYPDSLMVVTVNRIDKVLAPIEVSTSLTSGPLELVQGGQRLTDDHISQRASNSLSEALDVLPGVHAINTGVGIAKPMIRGYVGNRVQVLDNGVRQEGQQWGMDHGLEIDQFSVDRIDVITGPSTIAYGPAMLTGVVLIEPNWRALDTGFSGYAKLIGKSNNALIGQSTRLNYRSSNYRHIVSAQYSIQDFADYRVPAESFSYNGYLLTLPNGVLKNTAGTEQNYHLNYRYLLDEDDYIYVAASRFTQSVGLFPGAMGIPRAYDIANVGNQRDIDLPYQTTAHDKLIAEYYRKRGYFTQEVNLGFQHNHREERSKPHSHGLVYIDSTNTLGLGLDLYSAEGKYTLTHKKDNVEWKVGANLQYKENQRSGWEFLIPDYQRIEYGAFALLNWSTSSWQYNAGIRWDAANVHVVGYAQPWYSAPDSLVDRVESFNRLFQAPTVTFGFSRLFSNHWLFKGHVSYVSRIPGVNELASNGVHHGTFRHEMGNADLDAEQGAIGELSLFMDEHPVTVKVTGFGGYYSNFITLTPSGKFSLLPDAGQVYVYRQSPMAQAGGEVVITHDYAINEKSELHTTLLAEYVLSVDPTTGVSMPFQPPFSISLNPEYAHQIQGGSWSIGLEGQWFAAQNRVARNELVTPGYYLLNAYAGCKVGSWSFNLRGQNLTNTTYLRHLSRYRILNLPEQGVNMILQVSYEF